MIFFFRVVIVVWLFRGEFWLEGVEGFIFIIRILVDGVVCVYELDFFGFD